LHHALCTLTPVPVSQLLLLLVLLLLVLLLGTDPGWRPEP
jgi:hypothetical protein